MQIRAVSEMSVRGPKVKKSFNDQEHVRLRKVQDEGQENWNPGRKGTLQYTEVQDNKMHLVSWSKLLHLSAFIGSQVLDQLSITERLSGLL